MHRTGEPRTHERASARARRREILLRLATLVLLAVFAFARGLRTRPCIDLATGDGARLAPVAGSAASEGAAPSLRLPVARIHISTPLDIPILVPAGEEAPARAALPSLEDELPPASRPLLARDRHRPLRC